MRYARHFSLLVFAAVLLYGVVGFYFLPLANFEGGLSRMAMLPESQFGWTRPQPAIDPQLMQQSSWQEADVLVIGDSFSMPRIWQTALTRRGLRVHTETWESVRNVCEDFTEWLRSTGFKGHTVILQVIERNLEDRLNRAAGCRHMDFHQLSATFEGPPPTLIDRAGVNYAGRLSVGIRVKLHAMEYQRRSSDANFSSWQLPNEVTLARVAHGCELFSHPSCNDSLFYSGDHQTDFDDGTLTKIQTITARIRGFKPVWAIVPDKTTAYLHPDKKFWDHAEQRLHAVNLLQVFRQALQEQTMDLYRGNDTHTSTTGYLLMGEAIYRNMTAR